MKSQLLAYTSLALLASFASADGGDGGGDGGRSGGQDSDNYGISASNGSTVVWIHGIVMGVAFAVLFPLGAIILRLFRFRGIAWFHGIWQIVSWLIAVVGLGLGIWLANNGDGEFWTEDGHSIIGCIVVAVLTLQPIGGIIHHLKYKKYQRKTVFGTSHKWIGRIFLALGAINGGLGLNLSHEDNGPIIAYSVLAAFFFLLWALVGVWSKRRNAAAAGKDRKGSGLSTPSQGESYPMGNNAQRQYA